MSQMSPPNRSELMPVAEPPAWPKVMGIISIVLGGLGLPCGLCVGIMSLAMGPFMQKMGELQAQGGGAKGGPEIPSTQIPSELAPGTLSILSGLLWPLCAILMLMAGVMLLQRKPAGRTLHIVYGMISVLGTLIGLIGAWMYSQSAAAYMAQHPDDPWTKFFTAQGGGPSGQFVQAIGLSCVSFIYPAFVLIWFLFVKRNPADMGERLSEPAI